MTSQAVFQLRLET
eukprot:CCRYP_015422-RC/>CCRYP_015422-RC protein AED:0.47 eAED:1.00 QI:0/-1/0/1/-1/0/1/0/13